MPLYLKGLGGVQKFLDAPHMICDSCLHCRRNPERLVDPHEVVPREVHCERRVQTRPCRATLRLFLSSEARLLVLADMPRSGPLC